MKRKFTDDPQLDRSLLTRIIAALELEANASYISTVTGFFKKEYCPNDVFMGLRVPQCRSIVAQFIAEIDAQTVHELLNDDRHEIRITALLLLVAVFESEDHNWLQFKSKHHSWLQSIDYSLKDGPTSKGQALSSDSLDQQQSDLDFSLNYSRKSIGHASLNHSPKSKGHAFLNHSPKAKGHAFLNHSPKSKGHASLNHSPKSKGHAFLNHSPKAKEQTLGSESLERQQSIVDISLNHSPKTKRQNIGSESLERQQSIVDFYLNHTSKVNNWDLVDCSSSKILGAWFLQQNSDYIALFIETIDYKHQKDDDKKQVIDIEILQTAVDTLPNWYISLLKSTDFWQTRISIVLLLNVLKLNVDFALYICHWQLFRLNSDIYTQTISGNTFESYDLIHKVLGWIIRECGKVNKSKLKAFLDLNVEMMPRTTVRCACEHLDSYTAKRYLSKSLVTS